MLASREICCVVGHALLNRRSDEARRQPRYRSGDIPLIHHGTILIAGGRADAENGIRSEKRPS